MSSLRLIAFALFLAIARTASAQDYPGTPVSEGALPRGFEQAVYKGLVGNVLDAIPMDPSKRLDLQRTNAVVGNTLLGRTLTVLAGLSNPVLLLGGFVWGVWAASNIKSAPAGMNANGDSVEARGIVAEQTTGVASPAPSIAVESASEGSAPERVLLSSISAEDVDAAALSPAHVVKIWLSQRSSMRLQ